MLGTMTRPKMRRWAGETAEQMRVLSILNKDQSLVLSPRVRQLQGIHLKSSSGLHGLLCSCAHPETHAIQLIRNKTLKKNLFNGEEVPLGLKGRASDIQVTVATLASMTDEAWNSLSFPRI